MKVYISVDIEGVTGLVSWSQCSRPDGKSFDYLFARRMMTHDLNAAIRGARAAGAAEIVVKDSHGNSKNLLIEDLEPGVRLVSGHGSGIDGMMMGIDETFDAAFLVGYHAMAGTAAGVMEHTITGGIHRLSVNGEPCGEMGLSIGVAGRYGVPVVLVTSDWAGCEEAVNLLPDVTTVSVKRGLGRYMAEMLHPSETGPKIEAAAERALRGLRSAPSGAPALPANTQPGLVAQNELVRPQAPTPQPFRWHEPTHIAIEFNRSEEADMCAKLPMVHRTNGYTVEGTFATYEEAHQAVWCCVPMSFEGIQAQW